MKQQLVNQFFTNMNNNKHFVQSNGSITTTAPNKHKKNGSSTIITGNKYLVYTKHSSRIFKDSSFKLPFLTAVIKSQDTLKTAIERTNKINANIGDFRISQIHHRNKTEIILLQNNLIDSKQEEIKEYLDQDQKEEQTQIYIVQNKIEHINQQSLTISHQSEQFKFQTKVKLIEVLGEAYDFSYTNQNISKINKIKINSSINEIESLNQKSYYLIRKIKQLLCTYREKQTSIDLEIKKKKGIINLTDRAFTQTLSNMSDERTPKISDSKFNQQLSTIAQKKSKGYYNYSVQETESLTPLKTILEAIKEQKNDQKEIKEKSMAELQQKTQQISNKNLTITIIYEENEKRIEFQLPNYINDNTQQNQDQIKIQEKKQSNIYSLVTKQMLQSKFALRLIKKFGDKVIQTQKDNVTIENFNSFKASQFTRYYLQNHIQKCLETKIEKNDLQTNKNQIFDYLVWQETQHEMLNKNSEFVVINQFHNQINKSTIKIQHQIKNNFYKGLSKIFQSENSFLSSSESQLDLSDIEMQTHFKLNHIYYIQDLVSVNDLNKAKLRLIINTVDDETKNRFLHDKLMKFPEILNEIYQNQEVLEGEQFYLINKLEYQLSSRDQTIITNQFSKQFSFIQLGLFEDDINYKISSQEKNYIEQCKIMKNLDSFNTKDKYKNEPTSNLNIPSKSKSRLPSPTRSLQNQTQYKNIQKESNLIINKGQILKKHSLQKNLLTIQKLASSKNIITQSSKTLQTQMNTNTNIHEQKSQQFQNIQNEIGIQFNKQSQRQIKIHQHFNTETSMQPFSLLFRNMLLQESSQNEKSNIEKVFSLIQDHRLLDIKDLLLHDHNINIDTQDQNGNTFLICAAKTGSQDIIKFLLRQGADISFKNNSNLDAIQMAITHYHYQAADEINQFGRSNSYKF
ncbi:unnamed protein product [Paramecium pentaurelia]|uniref:Ankyrin repeat protein n=1 Tax=Paramecium pentaurelia TaxID=43138 RepID=A0A8S1VSE3_9CILI|nr:unnamed protein product [Paramecium pentaurelia]